MIKGEALTVQTYSVYKRAAARQGITVEQYIANLEAGLIWCRTGRHWGPKEEFSRTLHTTSGYQDYCKVHPSKKPKKK